MISTHSAQQSELHIQSETDQAVEPTEKHRRTYYAYAEDEAALAVIRARYGCSTESDAVRLALRMLAGDAIKVTTAPSASKRIVVKFKARPAGL